MYSTVQCTVLSLQVPGISATVMHRRDGNEFQQAFLYNLKSLNLFYLGFLLHNNLAFDDIYGDNIQKPYRVFNSFFFFKLNDKILFIITTQPLIFKISQPSWCFQLSLRSQSHET